MITEISSTNDRVLVVHQKLHEPIKLTVEYGSFHDYEFGIVDRNLISLVGVVNKMRQALSQKEESGSG